MSESAGPPATGAPKGPDRGDSGERAAGSAVAVVGSIVGAYLGVKVGTDQTAKALDQLDSARKAHEETSERAERYALHVE